MRRLLFVLPLLLLAGCGSNSDKDQIRAQYEKSAHAAAEGDAKTYCSLYTEASRQELAKLLKAKDCETGFAATLKNASPAGIKALKNLKVTSIKLTGKDRAEVRTTLAPTAPEYAVKENGVWKISLPTTN